MRKLILSLLLLGCLSLTAQEDLKVGLVLSGGGARGYAHIGALQVIEEAGIRVDYIGGTSMGSIVGGLYATGYSAKELEALLRKTDIMSELQDAIGRNKRPIYEKLYDEHYLLGLSLRDFAIQLPTALSDGQRIHDLFSHWTADVRHINDFSKLPIPFLCVGTDIVSGDAIVLEEGTLADAMRASAALPGVLSPYEMNGHVMTDGGVSNNYPAQEVKAKGMDYLIGITVEQDPYQADEINSLDKLLLQIAFFQATRRNVAQYEATDIDIDPDLGSHTQLSFEAIDELIAAGRLAAEKQLSTLRAVAQKQSSKRTAAEKSNPRPVEFLNAPVVEIQGNTDLSRRQILSFFEDKLPGKISWADFRDHLVALFATGRYTAIDYDWEAIENGEDEAVKLTLKLKQSPDFGQRLRLGLHYDQVYRANLLVGLTLNDVLVDNTLTTIDLIGGSRFRYRADYRVNRVNGSAFGLRSRLHYADVSFDLPELMSPFEGLVFDQLDYRFSDLNAELYWDIRQTTNSFTGIAAELKYYRTLSDQIAEVDNSSLFTLGKDVYFVPKAYFLYDKLNVRDFPMRGFSLAGEARGIHNLNAENVDENKWAFNADLDALFLLPMGKKVSAGLEMNVGGFLDGSSLPYRYYLGSNNRNLFNNFKLFPSINLGEASGENLLMGELFLRFNPAVSHYLTLGGRVARLGQEEGLPTSIDRDLLAAGRFTYGYNSPLGPIELTYARGNAGGQLYLNIGYWF
ncbi:patatin-like phospholipase family protein [Neolewinella agarilytica]|uniref:NTE family protein n=2 Tax=Neolewinella agarilytica TaxID=478744 RepID=A0A1H9LFW8_9BACT|nr:patatin-like phospholipase family protein [Neolewinella agarilytica]SER09823.1 NTE family protein [Neolewinella agarilytica]